jgi:hypothetical protein
MAVVTFMTGLAVLVVVAFTGWMFGESETGMKPVRVRRVGDGGR